MIGANGVATSGYMGNGIMSGHGMLRRAAIFCQGVITPVTQIHSLPPKNQPKAWLDIMSSNYSTSSDRIEAMEEIKILTKDKLNAKMFLDEGILDSLMYILDCYWHHYPPNLHPALALSSLDDQGHFTSARLACSCIVGLAKVHCLSTGPSSLLHSPPTPHGGSGVARDGKQQPQPFADYRNGIIPLERQIAQLLIEVPHYACRNVEAMAGGANGELTGSAAATEFCWKEVCVTEAIETAQIIVGVVEEKWNKRTGEGIVGANNVF